MTPRGRLQGFHSTFMAYATGTRIAAAICFFLSATLILAPITLPLGIVFYRAAKRKEQEREQELAAHTSD